MNMTHYFNNRRFEMDINMWDILRDSYMFDKDGKGYINCFTEGFRCGRIWKV